MGGGLVRQYQILRLSGTDYCYTHTRTARNQYVQDWFNPPDHGDVRAALREMYHCSGCLRLGVGSLCLEAT